MSVEYREKLAKERSGVTLETLEATPERSLKLLRGVGNNRVVRGLMQGRGYSVLIHRQGWSLLAAVAGMSEPGGEDPVTDPEVVKAVEDVDPHDEELVEITDASLNKDFPVQNDFLLKGITPGGGMAAVLNVALYLDRRSVLAQGTGREATRDDDLAALKLLEERGITSALCEYLTGRVAVAQSAKKVEPIDEAALKAVDEAYVKALADLRTWYELWSRIARVTIKRRDYLMLLGLAHRKSPTRPVEEEPPTPVES